MSEENTVSDLHAVALRAGVFQVVEREAKAAKDAAREELIAALPVGDAVAGRYGDELLCKASWSKGSEKVVVVDEAAFLSWVKEHHPTEVVVTESVNPAYLSALKKVDGALVDNDGQVADGVQVVVGKPTLSVRSEKGALELVARMVAEGQVSLGALKELTEAPESEVVDGEIVDAEVVE